MLGYLFFFSRRVLLLVSSLAPLLLTTPALAIPFDALVTAVTVDPQKTDRIYASTAGGLLRTDNRGETWQQLPIFPLGSRQPSLQRIEFDLTNTATIYGWAPGATSSLLVGTWRSVDRGANWQRIIQTDTFPEGSDLVRLLVAPTDGSVVYAVVKLGSAESTYRSGDGGATWVKGGSGAARAVSSGNAATLYRASFGRVYRSTNGAQSWSQIGQIADLDDTLSGISGIAVSPTNPDVLLATATGSHSSLLGIFRSTNGGSSWTRVLQTTAIGVFFNPANGNQAIAGDCCGISIYYSGDGGQTFSNVARKLAGFPDNFNGSLSKSWFDLEQSGRLIQGLVAAQGGGVAVAVAPNGLWNRLLGEYTPTAVPSAYLESGKMLSGDTSETQTSVEVVAAEGSAAPGFTIGTPSGVDVGASVRIIQDGTDSENPKPRVVVSRSAEKLSPGVYQTQLSIPVTGALNAQVTIEGSLEVVDQPDSPGVYLGRGLPPGTSASVYSLAAANGKVYVGSFGQLLALDGNGGVKVVAGTGSSGFSGDGGPATQAQLSFVRAIAVAPDGTFYLHDSSNRRIRRVAPDGKISTFAGNPSGVTTITDGADLDDISFLSAPGLAVRANGDLLLAHSNRIWRIEGNKFRTLAGGGTTSPADGVAANTANLSGVHLIQIDGQGQIIFATNGAVYRIKADNKLQHLAGASFSDNVPGSQKAKEAYLSIDALELRDDRIYIADRRSRTLMRIDPNGTIHQVGFNGMSGTASSCTGARYAPISSSITDGLVFASDGSLLVGQSGLPRFWIPPAGGAAGPAPAVSPEGVVNAASFARELSPGSLASVFGSNLSASQAAAPALPLPAQLSGGVICLAGRIAPLIFASPLQMNAQLPFGLQPGSHSLRAFNANGGSGSVPVDVQEASPGIFRSNGRAVVINPNGSLNNMGNGAAPGEVVVAYLTGIGDVTPAGVAGFANPADPLAVPNGATSAQVGAAAATLYYLGMTPNFAGLAQANVEIPALPPGEHLLVLTVGSYSSEPLTITVK